MILGSKQLTSFKEVIIYHSLKMLSSCIALVIVNPEDHSKVMEGNLVYNVLWDTADLDIKPIVVGFGSLQGWWMADNAK